MENVSDALDLEIAALRAQKAALQSRRNNLAAILLSSPNLPTRLQQRPLGREAQRQRAERAATAQHRRNQENLYRIAAGITAYRVKDPDPNAVDGGNVLGVRIEVPVRDAVVESYHVLLYRADAKAKNGNGLRIKHTTVPSCVPLRELAELYLPIRQKGEGTAPEQNLDRFAGALRQELVSWHLRCATIERLKEQAKVGEKKGKKKEEGYGRVINDFLSSDAEEEYEGIFVDDEDAQEIRRGHGRPPKITELETDYAVREITITWSDKKRARLDVAKGGEIVRAVCKSRNGDRVVDVERRAIGRIEGLIERLL